MTWYKNSEGRYGAKGKKGDDGEALVEEYCKKNKLEFVYKNDIVSQVYDKIDCVIEGTAVDVKTNYFKGYLCVELENNKKSKPGWLYTTKAKQIYGVDLESKSIYRYDIEKMKEYVEENNFKAKLTKFGDLVMWVSVEQDFIERLQ